MFFIIWGRRTITRVLGWAPPRMCENCHREGPWVVQRIRRWFTIFFIPVFPYKSWYVAMCPVCSHGFDVGSNGASELLQGPRRISEDEGLAVIPAPKQKAVAATAPSMSMLVATFNQTTSWADKTITYEEAQRQFVLQDHGPITAQDVLSYDAQGQLEWAREGLREWVCDLLPWSRWSRL